MKGKGPGDNKRFWSRWAARYDSFMHGSQGLYDQVAQAMKKSLTRNMNVLEVACGTGMISRRIAGSVKSLEATDFSAEMIAEARKIPGSSRLHYSVQDAASLPYADCSFDAVVIANALHIMPRPEQALGEIRRVLKTGGLLIAPTFVHGEGSGFRPRVWIMMLAGFRTYFQWSEATLVQYITEHGFSVSVHRLMGGGVAPLCYLEARIPAPNPADGQ